MWPNHKPMVAKRPQAFPEKDKLTAKARDLCNPIARVYVAAGGCPQS